MKKLILVLAFVFASGSFINTNASNSNNEVTSTTINSDLEEDRSCRSDCNWGARQTSLAISEDHEDRSTTGELMENYRAIYKICMEGC